MFGTLIGNGDGKDAVVDEDGIELEPAIPETFYWSVVDDADAKTGIYNEKNLIKNPGFEEIESMKSGFLHPSDENYDPTAESQYYPSYWTADDGDKGFSTGNSRVNVRSNYMNSMKNFEGDGVAMWHAYGVENFYQILDPSTLKSNTTYQIQLASWTHGDTKGTGSYSAKLGTTSGGDEWGSHTWTQNSESYYLNTVSFTVRTGVVTPDTKIYFSVKRNSVSIAQFDRMTMVEATLGEAPFGITASGISNIKYEDGAAWAPKIVLEDNEQYEMTTMIQNPDINSNAGWNGSNSTNAGEHYTVKNYEEGTDEFAAAKQNRYLDAYSGGNLTFDVYQNVTNLLDGVYTLECAARTNSNDFSIYANGLSEVSTPITNNGSGADAETPGELGFGWNKHSLQVIVKGGTLTIGAKGNATESGRWYSADEFRLYYVGLSEDTEVINALVKKIQDLMDVVMLDFDDIYDYDVLMTKIEDAYSRADDALSDPNKTEESLTAAYDDLNSTYQYVIKVKVPYADLTNAVLELGTLTKPQVEVMVNEAKAVFDKEDASYEDYVNANDNLWSKVFGFYKCYETTDETAEIINPTVDAEDNNSEVEGWTIVKTNGNTNTTTANHWSVPEVTTDEEHVDEKANRYFDSWNGTTGALRYEASQTIFDLQPGFYTIKAAIRTNGNGVYLFANSNKTEVPNNNNSGGELGRGWNWVEVPCVATADNGITFGVRNGNGFTGTWLSADDFYLTYYPAEKILAGIESNGKDYVQVYSFDGYAKAIGGEISKIFDISGKEISVKSKLNKGIYIVIVNNKSYRLFVK